MLYYCFNTSKKLRLSNKMTFNLESGKGQNKCGYSDDYD